MNKKTVSRLCAMGLAALLTGMSVFPAFAESEAADQGPGYEDTYEDSGRDAYEEALKSGDVTRTESSEESDEDDVEETAEEIGPGIIAVDAGDEVPAEVSVPETGTQGAYLGKFKVTGYCNCPICSGGSGLTYSGTVPKANHTIAADLSLYPIGTKLMCEGIIYTVEDCGSGVVGNTIDIYFDDHSKAVGYGTQYHDVYAVE